MAEVIPFKKPFKRRRVRPSTRKRHKGKIVQELIEECMNTGEPDHELMLKVLSDLGRGNFTMADIFAVYLYRKKING